MARAAVKKWNPKYNKVWVRMAMQNALIKPQYGDIGIEGKKFIKEVLAECDEKALVIKEAKEAKQLANSKIKK